MVNARQLTLARNAAGSKVAVAALVENLDGKRERVHLVAKETGGGGGTHYLLDGSGAEMYAFLAATDDPPALAAAQSLIL